MSAPQLTVQLYVMLRFLVSLAEDETTTEATSTVSPLTCASLVASSLSLLVTIFSYTSSDRLHCDTRRVVLMGHLTCFLWHACMTAARICALAVFTVGFGPYVVVVVSIHWLASVLWMAYEKTDFCGDITVRPQKRRTSLEVLFIMIISFVFLFIFFNVKNGPTLSRIVVYHVATCVETLIIVAVYYGVYAYSPASPLLFCWSFGLYVLGLCLMGLFFGVWHPSRTEDYSYVGVPRNCSSFSCCCSGKDKDEEAADGIGNVDLPLNLTSNSSSIGISYNVAQAEASTGLRCGTIVGMPGAGLDCNGVQRPVSNLSSSFMPNGVISSTPNPLVARSAAAVLGASTTAPATAPLARKDFVQCPDSFPFNQTECRDSGEQFSRPVSRLSTANMFETRGMFSVPVMTPSTGHNSPEDNAPTDHLQFPSSGVQRSQSDRVVRLNRARDLPQSQFTNGSATHRSSMAVQTVGPPRTDPLSRRSMWHTPDPTAVRTTAQRYSGSYARTQPTNMAGARGANRFRICSNPNPQRRSGYADTQPGDVGYPSHLIGGNPSIQPNSSYPQFQVNVTDIEPNRVQTAPRNVSRCSGNLVPLGRAASSSEYDHIPRVVNGAVHYNRHCGDSSYYHPQGYVSTYTSPAHLAAQRPRQRSLSPQDRQDAHASRRNSQRSRSRSATPGHSPFTSRRKSRQSGLYSHDALQEFTRFYTSSHVSPCMKPDEKAADTQQESDGTPQVSPPCSSSNQSVCDSVFIRSAERSPETSTITNNTANTNNTNSTTIARSGGTTHANSSQRSTTDTLLKDNPLDSNQYYHLTPLHSNPSPSSGTLV